MKLWAATTLPGQPPQPLVPFVLDLTFLMNPGMAWGLLGGATLPLAARRLTVRVALLVLPAAGALGNALDGFRLGTVMDMLASPALSSVTRAVGAGNFPVFNVTDGWMVSGVLLLASAPAPVRPSAPQADV